MDSTEKNFSEDFLISRIGKELYDSISDSVQIFADKAHSMAKAFDAIDMKEIEREIVIPWFVDEFLYALCLEKIGLNFSLANLPEGINPNAMEIMREGRDLKTKLINILGVDIR